MLSREALKSRSGAPGGALVDPAFQKKYPTVWDYMTQTQWEDGSRRETSTIGIYPEPGVIRVMLRDRAMGVCCWVAIPDLSSLWTVLEAAVSDPQHEWRVDRLPGQPAKRVASNGQPVDRARR